MKNSNKIAISLGLLILGCICVLFAHTLDKWHQGKIDAEKELQVIEGIANEVAFFKFHHKYGTKRMGEVIASAEHLLSVIRDPKLQITDKELELNLHKLTWLWLSSTPTTEYVALVNSGEIRYISSTALRSKFKELNMDQEKLFQFENIQVRYVDQHVRPFLNRHMDRTTIDTYQRADSLITKNYYSPFKNQSNALLRSREFANILTDLLFTTKRIMLPYKRMAVVLREMEEIMAEEYPVITVVPYEPF